MNSLGQQSVLLTGEPFLQHSKYSILIVRHTIKFISTMAVRHLNSKKSVGYFTFLFHFSFFFLLILNSLAIHFQLLFFKNFDSLKSIKEFWCGLLLLFVYLFIYGYGCFACMYACSPMCMQYPWRPGEGIRLSGTGVKNGCELP